MSYGNKGDNECRVFKAEVIASLSPSRRVNSDKVLVIISHNQEQRIKGYVCVEWWKLC